MKLLIQRAGPEAAVGSALSAEPILTLARAILTPACPPPQVHASCFSRPCCALACSRVRLPPELVGTGFPLQLGRPRVTDHEQKTAGPGWSCRAGQGAAVITGTAPLWVQPWRGPATIAPGLPVSARAMQAPTTLVPSSALCCGHHPLPARQLSRVASAWSQERKCSRSFHTPRLAESPLLAFADSPATITTGWSRAPKRCR